MHLPSALRALLCLVACFAAILSTSAQVPQLINYQGRVAVGTVNFDGPGQFRFALVNATGTTTYWSNDGTSTAGGAPTAAVSLPVAKGLYSVLLGDTTLPNMLAVPASVFANSDVRLRVWFNDGVNGSQLLTPDQRIAAVGYALMADTAQTVPNASITSAKLAPGAAAANLAASGQTGVPSGGVVLSNSVNPALTSAGYSLLGTTTTADVWQQRGSLNPPEAREGHTAVWSSSNNSMVIWGGRGADIDDPIDGTTPNYPAVGGIYTMDADTWAPTASGSGSPASGATNHTAVWAETPALQGMVIYGGFNLSGPSQNGGLTYTLGGFEPDKWTSLPSELGRQNHTAVVSTSAMFVWGGRNSTVGGRYTFNTGTWSAMSTTNAPVARTNHSAVWTGSKMIIWGGVTFGTSPTSLGTGAIYDPANDAWTALPTQNAPAARSFHTAVWTGTEMLIWGGTTSGSASTGPYLNSGARYDPIQNTWTPMDTNGAPVGRSQYTAVWTGAEMIIWGGWNGAALNSGARYNPVTNTWINLPADLAPSGRYKHSAVWTGSEMLVYGGNTGADLSSGLFSYKPGRTLYLYQRP
jgi:N-acetylneuraminic acid mutarotase